MNRRTFQIHSESRLKKLILLSLLVLGFRAALRAQSDSTLVFRPHTYLGIKAGGNYATARVAHVLQPTRINTGYVSGLHAGILAINYLEKNIGIQLELNYNQKGWSQLFAPGVPKYVTELEFVELPMYLNVYVGNKKTRLFFNLGFYWEYLINSSATAKPPAALVENYTFHEFIPSRDRKFGYGLLAGGGLYRDFSFGTLMVQAVFSLGVSNVIDPLTDDSGIPNISNLMTTTVSVAYMRRFRRR